jgi:hypothetical protein
MLQFPAGSPASNVAEMGSRLATDLREGTRTVPDFNDAVVRHGMLAAIEESARTGTRQTYRPDTDRPAALTPPSPASSPGQ